MEDKKRSGIKIVIIILSVLLAVSIAALAGTLIYRSVTHGEPAATIVSNNIILPDAEGNPSEVVITNKTEESVLGNSTKLFSGNASGEAAAYKTNSSAGTGVQSSSSGSKKEAAVLSLYRKHAEDNQPFQAGNMFPGDTETKYYCVKVSHSGDVIVSYRAEVRPGYEKLAEVLRCRVVLLTTGEMLYDGLMQDMPESLNYSVKTDKTTESELYYEITAYLDTSVGNEYQNKDLIADFRWWVQDTGNLDPPQTGDDSNIYLWLCLASGSLMIILILVRKRRKEEYENG